MTEYFTLIYNQPPNNLFFHTSLNLNTSKCFCFPLCSHKTKNTVSQNRTANQLTNQPTMTSNAWSDSDLDLTCPILSTESTGSLMRLNWFVCLIPGSSAAVFRFVQFTSQMPCAIWLTVKISSYQSCIVLHQRPTADPSHDAICAHVQRIVLGPNSAPKSVDVWSMEISLNH